MNKLFFIENRKKLLEKMADHSIAVLFSGNSIQKTADQDYDFEVDKNFYYLTGINQDKVILVLVKGKAGIKEVIFVEETSEYMEKWNGKKLTKQEVKDTSGIESVSYLPDFNTYIFNTLNPTRYTNEDIQSLYLNLERRNTEGYTNLALEYQKKFKNDYPEINILDCYKIIIGLRMYKTKEELALIQESINTTRYGIESLMKNAKAGLYEYQLESFYDHYIKFNGQKDTSFKTIAAAGVNATILHYVTNNTKLENGDLILFDLGCRTNLYISDISRTFPISGEFTERQKAVYNAVLNVNKKCIEFLKPKVSWKEYNEYASSLLVEELKKLGLIKEASELTKYYWHSVGHFIGLDTHDPGLRDVVLEEGMTLTVEPGIYIEEEKIGIRIEDDILITKDGCINLSKDIMKEVEEIEQFMKK